MLGVICVRDGVLPSGAGEVAAECDGRVLVVGSGTAEVDTRELGREIRGLELGPFAPARWARVLAPLLADESVVVLPSSPDGRDLAPRIAHALGRPLYAGAVEVSAERVTISRGAGLELHTFSVRGGAVATLQPGVRDTTGTDHPVTTVSVDPTGDTASDTASEGDHAHDPEIVAVLPPDVATMDLGEAQRILGGGAGLDGAARFEQLARVAARLGASMGATRVVTDRSWVGHERQIGTTGVVVAPTLYLSFAVSGAVQHTSGLGHPEHVISVNLDPHCPMMQMSDLAVVSDANAVLDELEAILDG